MNDSSVKILIRWTFADILEMNRHYPKNRVGRWACVVVALLVLLFGAYRLAFQEGRDVLEILPFPPLILLVGFLAPFIAGCGAWALKAKRNPYDLHASADGILLDYQGVKLHLPWNRFNRFQETSKLLMLFTGRGLEMLSLPKRCCTPDELKILRGLMTEKTASRVE